MLKVYHDRFLTQETKPMYNNRVLIERIQSLKTYSTHHLFKTK